MVTLKTIARSFAVSAAALCFSLSAYASEIDSPTSSQDREESKVCDHTWNLSTNLGGWGLAIANITGEYAFGCRSGCKFSTALSIYYSAWNYGHHNHKYRTFIFRPELRYWPMGIRSGLFIDWHVGMVAYNFVTPGREYRIQDHRGKNPALGGGVGIGYRVMFGKSRWGIEAQIGAGCYSLYYDRFVNIGNGPLVDTHRKTWFGIDNASLSIVFNLGPRPAQTANSPE